MSTLPSKSPRHSRRKRRSRLNEVKKREIVTELLQGEKTTRQVAQQYGISVWSVTRWRKKLAPESVTGSALVPNPESVAKGDGAYPSFPGASSSAATLRNELEVIRQQIEKLSRRETALSEALKILEQSIE